MRPRAITGGLARDLIPAGESAADRMHAALRASAAQVQASLRNPDWSKQEAQEAGKRISAIIAAQRRLQFAERGRPMSPAERRARIARAVRRALEAGK